jgi:hypothetical protein
MVKYPEKVNGIKTVVKGKGTLGSFSTNYFGGVCVGGVDKERPSNKK